MTPAQAQAARLDASKKLKRATMQRTRAVDEMRALAIQIARVESRLRDYDRRVKFYHGRALMTDEQLAADRAKRKPNKVRRGMKL